MSAAGKRLRVLVPVTGAFHGRLRVRRSTGELDTEGLERVLSEPSVRAITLAKQLQEHGAELVAVHVDKGGGEDVLREALAHGLDQGILIEGAAGGESDASTRAATIADVYVQNGPFDLVIGPAGSEFGGFSGALAAVAGHLDVPCAIGVHRVAPSEGGGFTVGYGSIFGDYDLEFPAPAVFLAGDVKPGYPSAFGIYDAYRQRGVLRVKADQYKIQKALSKRRRIEAVKAEALATEEVDGATLVRRLRARSLIPEGGA
ncbi:MAG: hypothetical protein ACPGQL_04755 [Thermoplasmatota archaeon]